MLKKNTFITVVLTCIQLLLIQNIKAQKPWLTRVDSLKTVTQSISHDTVKVIAYTALVFEYRNENPDSSILFSKHAQQLAEKNNFKLGLADALMWGAWAYMSLGKYDDALDYCKASMEIYNSLIALRKYPLNKILKQKGSLNNVLGLINWKRGKFSEAVSYYTTSLKLNEECGWNRGVGVAYQNLAMVYSYLKNNDMALKYYTLSLAVKEKNNDKLGMAYTLNGMSIMHFNKKDYKQALQTSLDAIKIFEEKGENSEIAGCYTNASNALKNLDRLGESKEMLEKGLAIHMTKSDINGIAVTKANLADIYMKMDSMPEAEKMLKESIALSEQIGGTFNLSVYESLSYIYQKQLRFEDALNAYKKFKQAADSVSGLDVKERIKDIETQYETEKKDNEIALQKLVLKDKEAALLLAKLQTEKKQTVIELLNKTKDIQELELTKAQKEAAAQMMVAQAQTVQLEVEKKDKVLKEQELSRAKLVRNILISASVAFAFIGLLLFNRYKLRKQIEQQTQLINQRKHISADLHDDVGSTLSSISIYSEAIKNKLNQNEPEKVMELVHKIGDNARETISNLSDIVWSINPANDKGKVLFNRMESFATSVLSSKDILLDFTCEQHLHALEFGVETKQNLFLIYKEAINNIAKHSRATRAIVHLSNGHHVIKMVISDNGKGFSTSTKNTNDTSGNGLKNMRTRAQNMHGEIKITSLPTGTTTELQFPVTPKT
ncbi:MAG TPA: tetratricopeptide repeat protein [Bacteroidia bacterium]|nr:tetratricopeptide repeat protein [Bacteroidia bacterium]HNU34657.1 tetratricopeptide repeat protein [Bacteroidia bacterium]